MFYVAHLVLKLDVILRKIFLIFSELVLAYACSMRCLLFNRAHQMQDYCYVKKKNIPSVPGRPGTAWGAGGGWRRASLRDIPAAAHRVASTDAVRLVGCGRRAVWLTAFVLCMLVVSAVPGGPVCDEHCGSEVHKYKYNVKKKIVCKGKQPPGVRREVADEERTGANATCEV